MSRLNEVSACDQTHERSSERQAEGAQDILAADQLVEQDDRQKADQKGDLGEDEAEIVAVVCEPLALARAFVKFKGPTDQWVGQGRADGPQDADPMKYRMVEEGQQRQDKAHDQAAHEPAADRLDASGCAGFWQTWGSRSRSGDGLGVRIGDLHYRGL